jgi:hypothetical protein
VLGGLTVAQAENLKPTVDSTTSLPHLKSKQVHAWPQLQVETRKVHDALQVANMLNQGIVFSGNRPSCPGPLMQLAAAKSATVSDNHQKLIRNFRQSSAPIAGTPQQREQWKANKTFPAYLRSTHQLYNITSVTSSKPELDRITLKGLAAPNDLHGNADQDVYSKDQPKDMLEGKYPKAKVSVYHEKLYSDGDKGVTSQWVAKVRYTRPKCRPHLIDATNDQVLSNKRHEMQIQGPSDTIETVWGDSVADNGTLTGMKIVQQQTRNSGFSHTIGAPLVTPNPPQSSNRRKGEDLLTVRYEYVDGVRLTTAEQLHNLYSEAIGISLAANSISRQEAVMLESIFAAFGRQERTLLLQLALPVAAAMWPAMGDITLSGANSIYRLTPSNTRPSVRVLDYHIGVMVSSHTAITADRVKATISELGNRMQLQHKQLAALLKVAQPGPQYTPAVMLPGGPVTIGELTDEQAMQATYSSGGTQLATAGDYLVKDVYQQGGLILVALSSKHDQLLAYMALGSPGFILAGTPAVGAVTHLAAVGSVPRLVTSPLSTAPKQQLQEASANCAQGSRLLALALKESSTIAVVSRFTPGNTPDLRARSSEAFRYFASTTPSAEDFAQLQPDPAADVPPSPAKQMFDYLAELLNGEADEPLAEQQQPEHRGRTPQPTDAHTSTPGETSGAKRKRLEQLRSEASATGRGRAVGQQVLAAAPKATQPTPAMNKAQVDSGAVAAAASATALGAAPSTKGKQAREPARKQQQLAKQQQQQQATAKPSDVTTDATATEADTMQVMGHYNMKDATTPASQADHVLRSQPSHNGTYAYTPHSILPGLSDLYSNQPSQYQPADAPMHCGAPVVTPCCTHPSKARPRIYCTAYASPTDHQPVEQSSAPILSDSLHTHPLRHPTAATRSHPYPALAWMIPPTVNTTTYVCSTMICRTSHPMLYHLTTLAGISMKQCPSKWSNKRAPAQAECIPRVQWYLHRNRSSPNNSWMEGRPKLKCVGSCSLPKCTSDLADIVISKTAVCSNHWKVVCDLPTPTVDMHLGQLLQSTGDHSHSHCVNQCSHACQHLAGAEPQSRMVGNMPAQTDCMGPTPATTYSSSSNRHTMHCTLLCEQKHGWFCHFNAKTRPGDTKYKLGYIAQALLETDTLGLCDLQYIYPVTTCLLVLLTAMATINLTVTVQPTHGEPTLGKTHGSRSGKSSQRSNRNLLIRTRTPATQRLQIRISIMLHHTTITALSNGHHYQKLAATRKHSYYKVQRRRLRFPANHWAARCSVYTTYTKEPPHIRTRSTAKVWKLMLRTSKTCKMPNNEHAEDTAPLTGAGPKKPPPRTNKQTPRTLAPPASVGLYAEPQHSHQCGAHALNSLLGRPATTGPGFIETYLRSTGIPPTCYSGTLDTPCYSIGGDYQVAALNHWLYEHTTENAVLYCLDIIPPRPAPDQRMSPEKLQELCPGCTEILILDTVTYGGHYYTWKQSPVNGEWYNLDSMEMTKHNNQIPKLTPHDWRSLHSANIYCLVQADAYSNSLTMQHPHSHHIDHSYNSITNLNRRNESLYRTGPRHYPLVKGRNVQVYRHQTRSARHRFLETEFTAPQLPSGCIPAAEQTCHDNPLFDSVDLTIDLGPPRSNQAGELSRLQPVCQQPTTTMPANSEAEVLDATPMDITKTRDTTDQPAELQSRPQKLRKTTACPNHIDQEPKKTQHPQQSKQKRINQIPGQSSILGFLPKLSKAWNGPTCPASPASSSRPPTQTHTSRGPCTTRDNPAQANSRKRQQPKEHKHVVQDPPTKHANTSQSLSNKPSTTEHPQTTPSQATQGAPPTCSQAIQDVFTNTTSVFRLDAIQCRGAFTSHIALQQHILDCKQKTEAPQVLFLSETKLTKKRTSCFWLRETLKGYTTFHSTHPIAGAESPKAGISVALQDILVDMSERLVDHTPEDLHGYLAHIELALPESLPLHIVGVYYPSHGSDKTKIRQRINSHIMTIAKAANAGTQTHGAKAYNILVGGDFNAAAFNQDRSRHAKLDSISSKKSSTQDKLHHKFISQLSGMGLHPTDTATRTKTFYRRGPMGEKRMISRIDDILATVTPNSTETMVINTEDWPTDHDGLRWQCTWNTLRLIPPPPEITTQDSKGKRKLKTPISQADYLALCQRLEETLAVPFHHLHHRITALLSATAETRNQQTEVDAHHISTVAPSTVEHLAGQPCQQIIDSLGEEISLLCQQGKDIAFRTCTTVPVQHDSRHCRSRVVNRRYKRVNKTKHQANTWGQLQDDSIAEDLLSKKTHRTLRQVVSQYMLEHPDKSRQEVAQAVAKQCQAELNMITKEHPTFVAQERRQQFQKLADEKQKLCNKIATGQHKKKNQTELKYLVDENTGELVTDPTRIKPLIHRYIEKRTTADSKMPLDTPYKQAPSDPEPFPFTNPKAVDHFHLENPAPNMRNLAAIIEDETTFHSSVKSLANAKCPGPDGVANELIKALPAAGKNAVHGLLKLMWATGCTPTAWKHSTTILLYKHKGNPTLLKGYRRIGLEITLYKLWTKMVTTAMTHYGETNAIHSHSQAGFRNKRSTAEQCEALTQALEDAVGRQDIYLLQIDFSEAFDTVDHAKMIQVLLALGYPQDAIRVVQNLYTDATTAVQTPYGLTEPIKIERGTLQGDGLSPLLFIIYLEPLLRWLRVGARGYQYSAFQHAADKIRHQTPDCTFADDLNILTSSRTDLAIQADKVTAYSQWARLTVNLDKTTATAALHKSNPQNPYDMKMINRRITSVVSIQGTPVKTQDPKKPFRYLGILFTMDLNWSHQFKHIVELTKKKLAHLRNSWLSRAQKLRVISTSIRPMITYSFPLAPYTDKHIKTLDSLLAKGWKQAYNLPVSTATAFAHEDIDKGGLGCPSLQVDYHAILAERLIRTLNDTTTTGHISRAVFEQQLEAVNTTRNAAQQIDLQQRSLRLRQLQALQQLDSIKGLKLMKDGMEHGISDKSQITNSLIATMLTPQLAMDICANHPAILADMLTLSKMGISTIHHLVNGSTGICLPATTLTKLAPGQTSVKHRKAINRITILLHTLGPNKVDSNRYRQAVQHTTPSDLSTDQRQVSRYVKSTVLSRKPPGYRIQAALANQTLRERVHPPLETDLTRKLPRHQRDVSLRKADIRVTETLDPTDEFATLKQRSKPYMTGWDLYQLIPAPTVMNRYGTSDKYTKERWGLYNAYAAADGTEIINVEAIQSASDKSTATTQQQLLVKWAGAIMPYWTLQLAQYLGYSPDTITAATHQEIMQNGVDTGCEYCILNKECKEEGALPTCDACCRSYHSGCLKAMDLERWQQTTGEDPWYCEFCQGIADELYADAQTTPDASQIIAKLPKALRWYKVEWQPHPEPKDSIQAILLREPVKHQSLLTQLSQLETAQQEPPRTKQKTEDNYQGLQLSNLAKQGIYTDYLNEQQRYDKSLGNDTAKLVNIHPQPINPHTDIHGPGHIDISLQQVTYMAQGELVANEVACIHSPDGGTPYTLPPDRLHVLYARFTHTQRHNPGLHDKLKAGTFAAETYKLLARYKESSRSKNAAATKQHASAQWALPAAMHRAICTHTQTTKERFASPLNVAASTHAFWTTFERDQIFGANWDAFKRQWTGSSIAIPTFEPAAVCKAVKHAIDSAKLAQDTPVLTTMIIPASSERNNPGYFDLIRSNSSHCKAIMRIPGRAVRFTAPPAYMQAQRPLCTPTSDILILEISNEAGRQHYIPNRTAQDLQNYRRTIMLALNEQLPPHDRMTATMLERSARAATALAPGAAASQTPQTIPPSQKIRNLSRDTVNTLSYSTNEVARSPYGPRPLKYNWRHFAYTDGSFIDRVTATKQGLPEQAPCVGSALYMPSTTGMTPDTTEGYIPTELDYEHDDTINRAELVALHKAITKGCTHIASDSLASIYQIFTTAHCRQEITLNYHRHASLLNQILATIQDTGIPIHIYKVPAHKGIVGNERADARASAIAKGTATPEETVDIPSNDRRHMWWPEHRSPGADITDTGSQNSTGPRPLPSLRALKTLAKASHALGSSNVQSIYFAARKTMKDSIDRVSSAYLTSTRVTCREATNALKVITGTLYTQARAFKMKKTSSPSCLLCGQPDGTMHAVSGCPVLSTAVTKRHNRAVTLISKAILTGTNGADVVSMDVSREVQNHEGICHTSSRISEHILPKAMPPALRTSLARGHRPDITLFRRGTGGKNNNNRYTFVEVKYCRDTQPEDQIMRAREQHHELIQSIRRYDKQSKVELVVIPLGVAGAIYSSSKELLKDKLGVAGPSQDRLLRNLHIHAVQALTKILRHRRIAIGTRTGKSRVGHPHCAADKPATGVRSHTSTHTRLLSRRYKKRKRKKKR